MRFTGARRHINAILSGGCSSVQLLPHQLKAAKAAVPLLRIPYGSLLNMTVGTGKTLTCIAILDSLFRRHLITQVIIVTKKSLVDIFIDDLHKCDSHAAYRWSRVGSSGKQCEVMWPSSNTKVTIIITTFDSLRHRHGVSFSRSAQNNRTALVVDEAHTVRNMATMRFQQVFMLSRKCQYVMLLSATPMWDSPNDLCSLLNLLHAPDGNVQRNSMITLDKVVAPLVQVSVQPTEFDHWLAAHDYSRNTRIGRLWRSAMVAILTYRPLSLGVTFPTVNAPIVRYIPMSVQQYKWWLSFRTCAGDPQLYYDAHGRTCGICGKLVPQTGPLPACVPGRQHLMFERLITNPYNVISRRFMNYEIIDRRLLDQNGRMRARVSGKSRELVADLLINGGNTLIYSPWLDAGAIRVLELFSDRDPTGASLDGSLAIIDGTTNTTRRKNLIDAYNDITHNLRILGITDSASEGINLKRTRRVHIFDSNWVWARTQQVIGRAVRRNSHAELAPADRNVSVIYWQSIVPRSSDAQIPTPELLRADARVANAAGGCSTGIPPNNLLGIPNQTLWCLNRQCAITDDQYVYFRALHKHRVIEQVFTSLLLRVSR